MISNIAVVGLLGLVWVYAKLTFFSELSVGLLTFFNENILRWFLGGETLILIFLCVCGLFFWLVLACFVFGWVNFGVLKKGKKFCRGGLYFGVNQRVSLL